MTGTKKILVMGDNHGDTAALDQLIAGTEGEEFDFIIHVGDLTNAYFNGLETGIEQLQAVESRLEELSDRANSGLLYIYGNRDHTRGPESEYVYEHHELSIGTRIPSTGTIHVGGRPFTQDPDAVADETILVTHGEYVPMIDHFDGRAYFSGHEHTGRYKNACLNSAFLYRTDDHGSEPLIGGYFVVEVSEDPPFTVDFRNLGRLKQIICPKHQERGVLFAPDFHECQFCYDGQLQLLQEMAKSSLYGLTHNEEKDSVSEDKLVEYALDLFETPPNDFEQLFTEYVAAVGQSPLDPIGRDENGQLVGQKWK